MMTTPLIAANPHLWTEAIELTDEQRRQAAGYLAEHDPAGIERIAIRCRRCRALKVYGGKRRPRGDRKVIYYREGRWVFRMGVCRVSTETHPVCTPRMETSP